MVNTLFKGRLSRISSTGATPCIPKTVEVKSVSHGVFGFVAILYLALFFLCYFFLFWVRYGTWNVYGSNNVNPYKYHYKLKFYFLIFSY